MIAAIKDSYDLSRWLLSAMLVIGLHAGLAVMAMHWHELINGGDSSEAILVDLAPIAPSPTKTKDDLAPGPLQEQLDAASLIEPPKLEQRSEEKVELPSVPNAEVELPQKPITQPDKHIPDRHIKPQSRPAHESTAPPKPRPSAAQISAWHRQVALQLERHKRYPAAARMQHEAGIAELAFTLDRHGRVIASRVARSSGSAALDHETLDTVKRAQPFPAPPPHMLGATFAFTVPIRFNIRDVR